MRTSLSLSRCAIDSSAGRARCAGSRRTTNSAADLQSQSDLQRTTRSALLNQDWWESEAAPKIPNISDHPLLDSFCSVHEWPAWNISNHVPVFCDAQLFRPLGGPPLVPSLLFTNLGRLIICRARKSRSVLDPIPAAGRRLKAGMAGWTPSRMQHHHEHHH